MLFLCIFPWKSCIFTFVLFVHVMKNCKKSMTCSNILACSWSSLSLSPKGFSSRNRPAYINKSFFQWKLSFCFFGNIQKSQIGESQERTRLPKTQLKSLECWADIVFSMLDWNKTNNHSNKKGTSSNHAEEPFFYAGHLDPIQLCPSHSFARCIMSEAVRLAWLPKRDRSQRHALPKI